MAMNYNHAMHYESNGVGPMTLSHVSPMTVGSSTYSDGDQMGR